MENRITKLFEQKKENILTVFNTAGFPELEDTLKVAKNLEAAGVDMLEIGIPFSDPIADGPVIQQSSSVALDNGMNLKVLFEQLKELRKEVSIPVLLMGSFNPIYQFGVEKFCSLCQEVGIDGLIIPDLPFVEFKSKYKALFDSHNLSNIFLITPETSDERIRLFDAASDGFLYVVSVSSTTGKDLQVSTDTEGYFERLSKMDLKQPLLVGFGVSNKETFKKAAKHTSGAIVGSAFIKSIENSQSFEQDIKGFVQGLR